MARAEMRSVSLRISKLTSSTSSPVSLRCLQQVLGVIDQGDQT